MMVYTKKLHDNRRAHLHGFLYTEGAPAFVLAQIEIVLAPVKFLFEVFFPRYKLIYSFILSLGDELSLCSRGWP